jgi:hypothetical protein
MNVTTQALDDAGLRISRYLLMQFLVNVTYGVPIGVAPTHTQIRDRKAGLCCSSICDRDGP